MLLMHGSKFDSFTIAVLGHNESPTLRNALEIALAGSGGATVIYVDSGSTDNSVEIAESLGVKCELAPIGKGRAVAAALGVCKSDRLCLLDADIHDTSNNIASILVKAADGSPAALHVGDFSDGKPGVLSNTVGIYEPLTEALFPELTNRIGARPLSGFRVVDTRYAWGDLPPDFGVEAHMNIVAGLMGRNAVEVVDVGEYLGRFLYKPHMGLEIASAILDLAVETGRLSLDARPTWEKWVNEVVAHIATYKGDESSRAEFVARLLQLAATPLPSSA